MDHDQRLAGGPVLCGGAAPMKCKYCRHLFDGRKHACPDCGKDRHYKGKPKYRGPSSAYSLLMPFAIMSYGAYQAGRKRGHEDAKDKLEELE